MRAPDDSYGDFSAIDFSGLLDFSGMDFSNFDFGASLANIDYEALSAMADPGFDWAGFVNIDPSNFDTGSIQGDGKFLGENNTDYGQGSDTEETITGSTASTVNQGSTVFFDSTPTYYAPSTPPATPAIKTGTPQYILFNDDEVPVDAIVDLLFENIGGQELLSIGRSDTVNGQKVLYQPIKNLNILKEQYNPNNVIRLQNTSDKFFSNFSIKLTDKIPNVGNGPNGTNVYLDSSGNLVIEFINLFDEEQAEIEITSSGIINEVGI
jgi:hypothetical protein